MYHLSLWNYFRYKVDQCSRYQNIVTTSRNSHLRCFLKKGVLWNFAKFTGINKVAGLKFLRIPFLQNISGRLLLNCFLKIFKTSIVSCRFQVFFQDYGIIFPTKRVDVVSKLWLAKLYQYLENMTKIVFFRGKIEVWKFQLP